MGREEREEEDEGKKEKKLKDENVKVFKKLKIFLLEKFIG